MPDPMPTVLSRWPSTVFDPYAEPVNGTYAAAVWRPRLGPTSFLLWGVLVEALEAASGDATVDLVEIATSLGVGQPGRHGWALTRSLQRLRTNRLVRPVHETAPRILVRTNTPAIGFKGFCELPTTAQALHLSIYGAHRPPPA